MESTEVCRLIDIIYGRLNRPRYASLVLCCLDGERVVSNDDNSVLIRSDR